ncbi:MAG TPA: NIPSNAP family protein [Bryobacteraceae bacterium]|nr:NIPSNAP family protein [Bryobacteraceae bacterium]
MNRRSFVQSLSGAAALPLSQAAAQPAARKTRIYRMDYLDCRQGSQTTRLHEFLSSQTPLLAKNTQAFGVFTSLMGAHLPATIVLSGFPSLEEMEAADERLRRNGDYQRAMEKMEAGSDPPYDRAERVLLRATEFSPEITPLAEKPKTPRVFELRIYHSPTERQLRYLHERFAGAEIGLFHRSGIHPILYADTLSGPNMPNLTYLTPFASLAEQEKARDAFAADPEWAKTREESVVHGGQIVAESQITFLRPTPFSPIQ